VHNPTIFLVALALALASGPTFARPRHHHTASRDSGTVLAHPAGCPRTAFCGCGVSVRVFGHSVRSLWLASAWRRFPPTSAAPGMVAIWRHHVAYIVSLDANGNAVLYDPNSGGHQTRQWVRSLAGARIVNPNG
jgi:hypothetical protein